MTWDPYPCHRPLRLNAEIYSSELIYSALDPPHVFLRPTHRLPPALYADGH
ncbi:hypothetical protein P879_09416 [Paragonimus westermani]|uniref:Uncharacterized protein n=1 Tax=Paragonimus westermani TaxID=34504 RepID=A0A8T0CXY5_9TREM|nr:hypothetical protein P879_09416 [Paragonimus westermani]